MVESYRKRRVAVLGWYGHDNFGDSLILEGFRSLFRGWTVVPMSSAETVSVPYVNVDEINRCDLFVLGGGELISSNRLFVRPPVGGCGLPFFVRKGWSKAKTRLFNDVSWVHKVKVPKAVLGCGVDVDNASELDPSVVSELGQFDFIGLRDLTAVNLLKSFECLFDKVNLFYDLAFSLCLPSVSVVKYSGKTAVVFPTDRNNCIACKSVGWLSERLKKFDRTVFVPFGQKDNNDYETCKFLAKCIDNSVVFPNNLSLEQVCACILGADKVFAYRLHGFLLSFLLGKECEVFAYHRKLKRNYETIKGLSVDQIKCEQKKKFELLLNCVR
jgi:exopolysaccharide biosynthesis predicted pyruvyltransferase EpsI